MERTDCGSNAVPGVKGLVETIEYIRQREKTLSRYSDKLRQSLVELAGLFGKLSDKYCRRCGYHAREHSEDSAHFKYTCQKEPLVPKIEVSIVFIDCKAFTYDSHGDYYLAINRDHELVIRYIVDSLSDTWNDIHFKEASRRLLKELVKSGRIPRFFEGLAERLSKLNGEYREAAEQAEKIAAAVKAALEQEED